MKLALFVISLVAIGIGSTAHAQFESSRPVTLPGSAPAGGAQTPRTKQPLLKPGAVKAQPAQQHVVLSQQTSTALLVGGGDSCAVPDLISGPGPFTVDNTAAATGAEGQMEPLCFFFSTTGITNDVWFNWTSGITGTVTLSLCAGTTGIDSKVAIYNGSGCPTSGTAIACNDDFCSLVSQLSWSAVSGQSYVIQIGNFPGALPYNSSFTIVAAAPGPANDNCTGATAISGFGNFPVDTTGATGSIANGFCAQPNNDVWFAWTASTTGPTQLSFCGLTGTDTVAAVWSSGSCPPTTLVACNDDFCGLQTQITFAAVAGTTYLFELGAFGATTTYIATFNVQAGPPPPAGDDCATPVLLSGVGPYAYDNTNATTAPPGVPNPLCNFFSSTAIDRNLWFCWTAPSSGSFDVTTIGFTFNDTKLAVYDGCGCPVLSSIACNDDACGTLQSTATFNAIAGNSFTIEIGNFPGANGGPGAFDVVPTPVTTGCQYDDGSSENSIGLTAGGEFLWLNPFGSIGAQTLVTSVSAAYGTPLFPGAGPAVGTPVNVCVYDDPNDDGDPTDAVLISITAAVVGNVDNDVLDTYAVPSAVLNGRFFVGVALIHPAGQFPAALDSAYCGSAQTWGVGSTTAPFDYNVLTNNSFPPISISGIFGGICLVRAGCATNAGTSFCGNGDPNRIPCPCGNNGTDPNAGCANSQNAAGALMTTTGFTQTDDVVLHGTGMSGSICIFIRTLGPQQASGAVFGDGITCTGGSLLRLRAVSFAGGIGGTASFPVPPETITLSARSGTFPSSGATMQYSGFYRNAAAAFCPPFTFNTHNTIELTW